MSDATPIGPDDVVKIANLARLTLTDDEVSRFTEQLRSVLNHARDLAALDVHNLKPTAHPLGLVNVLRADIIEPSLDRDEVLSQAPNVVDNRFSVPRIVGEAP